ncbi:MAG: monooxygenase [Polyangiaceae bacterium]
MRLPSSPPSRSSAFARLFLPTAALALAALAVASCTADPSTPEGAVSYQAAVRPILEARCTSCHHDGGPAPFSMEYNAAEWEDGAPAWVGSAVSAVEDGRMPPWLPSGDCRDLAYPRSLTDDEKSTLLAWRDGGFPEGDPASYPGPMKVDTPPELGAPDLVLTPDEAYTPSTDEPDDYRCFILPADFIEETWMTASTILPGDTQMVHHVLLYLIPPESVASIEGIDSDDPGPGYTCFGGPGSSSLTTLGGWVPGSVTEPLPDGAAMIIPAGSKIVMQIHYNTLALNGGDPPADKSTAQIWTAKEKPVNRVESLPMAHLGMKIPAGEEASVQERLFEMPVDGSIIALTPHMHLLGTQIQATIEPAAEEPACLIDIPRWDFHWQQSYGLTDTSVIAAKKGDKVRLRCTYDNSAANQPIIGGTPKVPEDVTWGEGTLDEMCLLYVMTMVPYDAPDFRCGAYPSCIDKCPDGDSSCFFDCATVGGGQCAGCLVTAVGKCAPPYCAATGLEFQACAKSCDGGPGCFTYDCKPQFDAFYACMQPHLEAGDCAPQLAACGL